MNEVDRLDTAKPEEAFKVDRGKDGTLEAWKRKLTSDDLDTRKDVKDERCTVSLADNAPPTENVSEFNPTESLEEAFKVDRGKDGTLEAWKRKLTSDDLDTRKDVTDERCTVSLADNAPPTENVSEFNPTESLEGIDGTTDTSEECSARTEDDGEYFNVSLDFNAPLTLLNVWYVSFKASLERRNVIEGEITTFDDCPNDSLESKTLLSVVYDS